MQCLDETANLELTPSQGKIGKQTAFAGGEDVMIRGDNSNRHDNWRELLFEISPCTPDPAKGKACRSNADSELAKMDLVFMYN